MRLPIIEGCLNRHAYLFDGSGNAVQNRDNSRARHLLAIELVYVLTYVVPEAPDGSAQVLSVAYG